MALQGLIPLMLQRISAIFPVGSIYSPADHGSRGSSDWPSIDDMAADGKRVLLLSGVDYGPLMQPLIFDKCGRCPVPIGFASVQESRVRL